MAVVPGAIGEESRFCGRMRISENQPGHSVSRLNRL